MHPLGFAGDGHRQRIVEDQRIIDHLVRGAPQGDTLGRAAGLGLKHQTQFTAIRGRVCG